MKHRRFKNTWVARTTEFSQKVIEKIEKSRKTIFSMSSDYSYVLIIFQGENKKQTQITVDLRFILIHIEYKSRR